MTSKLFPLLILIFLFNCNNDVTKKKSVADSIRKKITGQWGGLGEDKPVWLITADSIYYFDQKKSYPYDLNGDSLTIRFPDNSVTFDSILIVQDTLSFKDDLGLKIFAYRFKNKN